MKILEKGREQKGWAKEKRCTGLGNGGGGCGALLLVEEADVFRTAQHARDESEYFATFACCACGVWTDLDDFPHGLQGLPSAPPKQPKGPTTDELAAIMENMLRCRDAKLCKSCRDQGAEILSKLK